MCFRYGGLLSSACLSTSAGSELPPPAAPTPRRSMAGSREKKIEKNHIKKPLNAFMLYMKEMRPRIVAECTLKESAAINQILGRRVLKRLKSYLYMLCSNACYYLVSGTVWVARSRPSITNWRGKSANCTCKCTPVGRPEIITLKTRRKNENGFRKSPLLQTRFFLRRHPNNLCRPRIHPPSRPKSAGPDTGSISKICGAGRASKYGLTVRCNSKYVYDLNRSET